MFKSILGPVGIVLLAALTTAAGPPPNLGQTLKAQQELTLERPHDPEVHNDFGNLLVLDGRLQEAEEAYRRAIDLEPTNTLARFNLGVLLQQSGRAGDAAEEFRGVLEIDDRHGRAHYQLGVLLESRGQRKKALDHYSRAFAFDPRLTFASNNPHLIDNQLATEAILLSERYYQSSSTEIPRIYGEPDRIVDLMLEDLEEEPPAEAEEEEGGGATLRSHGGGAGSADLGGSDPESEEYESRESGDEGRRALTNEDLDVGSSLGQVRRGSTRRRPAIGTGRSGRSDGRADRAGRVRRPSGLDRSGAGVSGQPTGRANRPPSDKRRYIPGVASTGRLELKLLPEEPAERLSERLAERRAEVGGPSAGQTLKRM